jgi:hypothetical protein
MIRWVLCVAAVISVGCAHKGAAGDGVPVRVYVLNQGNDPIPTGVVRHPEESDRHRVNVATGHWEGSVLYMPDGSEMVFTPGMSIQLEVSAPGFLTRVVQYDIRKRRNHIRVNLDKIDFDSDDIEEPIIQFGRDKPREDGAGGPSN